RAGAHARLGNVVEDGRGHLVDLGDAGRSVREETVEASIAGAGELAVAGGEGAPEMSDRVQDQGGQIDRGETGAFETVDVERLGRSPVGVGGESHPELRSEPVLPGDEGRALAAPVRRV